MHDPNKTWKKAKEFLREKINSGGLENLIMNDNKPLTFNTEIAYIMRVYLRGKESKLEVENCLNPTTALLVPFIKEATESAGVINPKPQHKYQEAQYKFDLYLDYKDKIKAFAKSMNLTI